MYKATIEIGRINKTMKIKFGLVVRPDESSVFKAQPLVNKFSFGGNDYIRVSPNPFIVIDISSSYTTKGEAWSSNQTVTLNKYYLFRFLQGLKRLISDFQTRKNLFYYRNNELFVNDEVANTVEISIQTAGSKTILMRPCVVPDEESTTHRVYEGCIFYINNMENFAYLTYTEIEYLYYELTKIDMSSLAMQLITVVSQYEGHKSEKIIAPPSPQTVIDSDIEISTPSSVTIIKKNEIPQI